MYERLGVLALSDVLPHVLFRPGRLPEHEREFLGQKVWMNSWRYQTFATSGTNCCKCGLTGAYFALERDDRTTRYHLNLYGVTDAGEEVLFTKDHIVPLVRGGRDSLDNFQTLCARCNVRKADHLVE